MGPPPYQNKWSGSNPMSSTAYNSQWNNSAQGGFGSTSYSDDGGGMYLRGAGDARGDGANDFAVSPWHTQSDGGEVPFLQEGAKVRIVGLTTEPTWDGAEGVFDSYDQAAGMVRIEFPDGRTKSVRLENCEAASRYPQRESSAKLCSKWIRAVEEVTKASKPDHKEPVLPRSEQHNRCSGTRDMIYQTNWLVRYFMKRMVRASASRL